MLVSKAGAFIRLTRPFFLLGGVMLYLLGVSMALSAGTGFNLAYFLMGQFLVTFVQLTVHYANEYYDREVDQTQYGSRTWFSGGSGALAGDILSPLVALRAAQVCAGVSLIILVVVAFQMPVLALLGLMGMLAAWFYSAPPLRLVSRGWGEVDASVITAFCVPFAGLAFQNGTNNLPPIFFVVCVPLVLIHISMMIAFEFPDVEADKAFGKYTLAVRLGLSRAAWLHNGLIGAAFILYGLFAWLGCTGAAGRYVFLVLPLALWQMARIRWQLHHPKAGFHWLTMGAVSLFGLTAIMWLLGFLI
jgi:1,4-dihydroxy-2-naphthoate octaprenyltransferase